uniref:Tail fiber domain-containing protein n=1 Tax=Roseihalotalea indica TaxID=2867963 RepID=A0AA49JIR9_9BACT|nr:tail fiber domain-containing protein [Tunicatimonas sp. TK19036]
MRFIYFILGLLFCGALSGQLMAQSVGVGTNTPSSNAALHVVSQNNNQGILIPSLSTEQRTSADFVNNLSSEDNGLLVFDLTEKRFYFWSDDAWMPLVSGTLGQILEAGEGITINEQSQIVNIGDVDSTNDVTVQTVAAGDVTGIFANLQLSEQSVETTNLADNAVVSSKIADETILPDDLASPGAGKVLITTNAGTVFWENQTLFGETFLEFGNVYVGNAGNKPSAVDLRGEGNILIGGGTNVSVQEVKGDITMDGLANAELTSNSVASTEILDGSVTTIDIADEAITSVKILDGSISSADLSADAVGSGTIVNETILNEDIGVTAGIQVSKLEAMATGTIIFGNAGVPTIGAIGGAISVDETGAVTLNTLTAVDIDGGTIDNTPIGGTTPSTGDFTTLTAVDGNFTTLTATDGNGILNLNADNLAIGTLPSDRFPDLITAGTYGGGPNHVESITVDAKGRVTAVAFGPSPSDIRLKENIQELHYSPQNLNQLQAYHYTWKENQFGNKPQIGLIAQEVEKVYPELVQTRSDGYKGVNYEGLIPVLVEAAKAQQDSIHALQTQNQSLENKVAELEASLENQSQLLKALEAQVKELMNHLAATESPSVTETEAKDVRGTDR